MCDSEIKPDPELKALREENVSTPDVTKLLPSWLHKGERFSMRKLAGSRHTGWDIIHTIARFIDGTPVNTRADWKVFASHLGLTVLEIIVFIQFTLNWQSKEIDTHFIITENPKL